MKTRTIVLFVLLIMMPGLSYGQLRGLLKNAASKTLGTVGKESAIEAKRQADSIAQLKATNAANAAKASSDSASNQINSSQTNQAVGQGDQPQQQSQGQGGTNFGKFFGGKVDLKYNDVYNYASRLYMETESYEKKGVTKMDLYMYYSANSPNIGMETKSVTDDQGKTTPVASSMVMDGENKCFIILTDMGTTKMGIISPIPDKSTTQNQQDGTAAKNTPTNFTKTGNTKVIAGYKCDEYTYTVPDNKTSGKLWFTKDANLQIDSRGWQKTGMGSYYGYAGFEGGIILANETYDSNGKLTLKSETKEINTSFPHSITVQGYTLRQMNLNQGQPKK
jgi:hypothetical protein